MRVAIYARVSSGKQTVENQVPVLTQWCQQRQWEIVLTGEEEESAWQAGHQPVLARLIEAARKAQYDLLAVWALDRLSRAGIGPVFELVTRFKKYGVRVVSYQEPWTELPSETSDLFIAIAGWIAQQESHRRSERVKAGLLRAKMNGMGVRGPDQHKRKRRWRRRPNPQDETVNLIAGPMTKSFGPIDR